ncbi:unnamed protein product [Anisakis simplex]|uniref:Galactosylgalactosylxylosylprotein 3-beta-glucuronosyltransferase n=1 Tax=Anisakis simplex TaxID=6269 RepID=A0A0M3K8M1_ANISI|nr:unnamed protein product [Anisakis simplex]
MRSNNFIVAHGHFRLSQTLMHIDNLIWIVIEDSATESSHIRRLLKRSRLPFCYMAVERDRSLPVRGWTAREFALRLLKERFRNFGDRAVVYFADDDNSYDVRLFDGYIRNVETVGVWAVGLAGKSAVEAQQVDLNGNVVGWLTQYAPKRTWAIDMAGFAINLKLILSNNATFRNCRHSSPEPCLLSTLNIRMSDLQPFGHLNEPRDILVWHTKTLVEINKPNAKTYGYVVES